MSLKHPRRSTTRACSPARARLTTTADCTLLSRWYRRLTCAARIHITQRTPPHTQARRVSVHTPSRVQSSTFITPFCVQLRLQRVNPCAKGSICPHCLRSCSHPAASANSAANLRPRDIVRSIDQRVCFSVSSHQQQPAISAASRPRQAHISDKNCLLRTSTPRRTRPVRPRIASLPLPALQ